MHRSILITEGVYHIFSKSIAGFKIFNNYSEFLRMQQLIKYYQIKSPPLRFSQYVSNIEKVIDRNFINTLEINSSDPEKIINIIAYCIMPTHIHLVLKQLKDNGISIFMNNILNSYTRYFNIKYKRKGPLWETRFKRVLVATDEQLLHLTRYVHLNPVTAYLANKPEEWNFSSYREYLFDIPARDKICNYEGILDITPQFYKKFVEENIDYQRELAKIKALIVDQNCTA